MSILPTIRVHSTQKFLDHEFEIIRGTADKVRKTVVLERHDGVRVLMAVDDLSVVVDETQFDALIFNPAVAAGGVSPEARREAMIDAFERVANRSNISINVRGRLEKLDLARLIQPLETRRQGCGGCGLTTTQTLRGDRWECGCCAQTWEK